MPSVPEGVVEEVVDDQLILYDCGADRVHILNLAAAAVFDLCDGKTSVSEIVQELKEAVPEGSFDCDHEVPRILGEMLDQGLLESSRDRRGDRVGVPPRILSYGLDPATT
ncbi:MAG: PqqD family protein [Acidobacteriota bacterium]